MSEFLPNLERALMEGRGFADEFRSIFKISPKLSSLKDNEKGEKNMDHVIQVPDSINYDKTIKLRTLNFDHQETVFKFATMFLFNGISPDSDTTKYLNYLTAWIPEADKMFVVDLDAIPGRLERLEHMQICIYFRGKLPQFRVLVYNDDKTMQFRQWFAGCFQNISKNFQDGTGETIWLESVKTYRKKLLDNLPQLLKELNLSENEKSVDVTLWMIKEENVKMQTRIFLSRAKNEEYSKGIVEDEETSHTLDTTINTFYADDYLFTKEYENARLLSTLEGYNIFDQYLNFKQKYGALGRNTDLWNKLWWHRLNNLFVTIKDRKIHIAQNFYVFIFETVSTKTMQIFDNFIDDSFHTASMTLEERKSIQNELMKVYNYYLTIVNEPNEYKDLSELENNIRDALQKVKKQSAKQFKLFSYNTDDVMRQKINRLTRIMMHIFRELHLLSNDKIIECKLVNTDMDMVKISYVEAFNLFNITLLKFNKHYKDVFTRYNNAARKYERAPPPKNSAKQRAARFPHISVDDDVDKSTLLCAILEPHLKSLPFPHMLHYISAFFRDNAVLQEWLQFQAERYDNFVNVIKKWNISEDNRKRFWEYIKRASTTQDLKQVQGNLRDAADTLKFAYLCDENRADDRAAIIGKHWDVGFEKFEENNLSNTVVFLDNVHTQEESKVSLKMQRIEADKSFTTFILSMDSNEKYKLIYLLNFVKTYRLQVASMNKIVDHIFYVYLSKPELQSEAESSNTFESILGCDMDPLLSTKFHGMGTNCAHSVAVPIQLSTFNNTKVVRPSTRVKNYENNTKLTKNLPKDIWEFRETIDFEDQQYALSYTPYLNFETKRPEDNVQVFYLKAHHTITIIQRFIKCVSQGTFNAFEVNNLFVEPSANYDLMNYQNANTQRITRPLTLNDFLIFLQAVVDIYRDPRILNLLYLRKRNENENVGVEKEEVRIQNANVFVYGDSVPTVSHETKMGLQTIKAYLLNQWNHGFFRKDELSNNELNNDIDNMVNSWYEYFLEEFNHNNSNSTFNIDENINFLETVMNHLYHGFVATKHEMQGKATDERGIIRQTHRLQVLQRKHEAIQQFCRDFLNFEDPILSQFFPNLVGFIKTRSERLKIKFLTKKNESTNEDEHVSMRGLFQNTNALEQRENQIKHNLQALQENNGKDQDYERIHHRKELIFFIHYVMFLQDTLNKDNTSIRTYLQDAQNITIAPISQS